MQHQTPLNQARRITEIPVTKIHREQLVIEVDGIARPVRNSLGCLIHWSEEGVRNFWRWYAPSKMVAAGGVPLVVFHGTDKSFTSFNPKHSIFDDGSMFFSSSPRTAFEYAKSSEGHIRSGSNVMALYLAMANPLVIDFAGDSDQDGLMDCRESALEQGRDGIVALNVDDGYGLATQFVAFRAAQIKSAIGDCGAFSPGASLVNLLLTRPGFSAAPNPAPTMTQVARRPKPR